MIEITSQKNFSNTVIALLRLYKECRRLSNELMIRNKDLETYIYPEVFETWEDFVTAKEEVEKKRRHVAELKSEYTNLRTEYEDLLLTVTSQVMLRKWYGFNSCGFRYYFMATSRSEFSLYGVTKQYINAEDVVIC